MIDGWQLVGPNGWIWGVHTYLCCLILSFLSIPTGLDWIFWLKGFPSVLCVWTLEITCREYTLYIKFGDNGVVWVTATTYLFVITIHFFLLQDFLRSAID